MPKDLDEIYKRVCALTGEKTKAKAKANKKSEVLKELKKLENTLKANKKQEEENSKRIDEILKVVISFANLKYDKKARLSNKKSHFDALALGINMLGEELEASTISLHEKEVLLKEIHHRVKNNMQIISSILNLQSSYVTDNYTLALLKESQNRIKTMAYIHESLYQNKSFTSVNFSEYIQTLSKNIIQSYVLSSEKVELILNLEKINLNLDVSIPAGLIINELITNAIKHAFPDAKKGKVCLNLKSENNNICLEVTDNGVGIPPGVDYNNTNTLGLQLVNTLIDQLDGEIKFKSEKDKGTEVLIKFKM